jgi:hypothetical protein
MKPAAKPPPLTREERLAAFKAAQEELTALRNDEAFMSALCDAEKAYGEAQAKVDLAVAKAVCIRAQRQFNLGITSYVDLKYWAPERLRLTTSYSSATPDAEDIPDHVPRGPWSEAFLSAIEKATGANRFAKNAYREIAQERQGHIFQRACRKVALHLLAQEPPVMRADKAAFDAEAEMAPFKEAFYALDERLDAVVMKADNARRYVESLDGSLDGETAKERAARTKARDALLDLAKHPAQFKWREP